MIILILKILFDVCMILYPFAFVGLVLYWSRRLDKVEKQIKKSNADINSLHQNQQLLVSHLKVIQGNIRKHDKPKLRFSSEKTWQEKSGERRDNDKATEAV